MSDIKEIKEHRLFGLIPIWKSITTGKGSSNTINIELEESSDDGGKASAKATKPAESSSECLGTKGDQYAKELIQRIIDEGCRNKYPSSTYDDGEPAYTYGLNHYMMTYDLTKGEIPLMTLRPIAVRFAVRELLWIYQDQSNDLDLLRDKYGITWWDEWDIGDRTIGAVYGETVRRHDMVNQLLEGIKSDPDGRRHIINMWQVDDFKDKHGHKPCAYQTAWNVRHGRDGVDYLDMCLFQRSSDFMAAGCINQMQYLVFLHLIARHCGYTPGRFTWFVQNIHIYDRHMELAKELINRQPVACKPYIWLNPDKKNFFDFMAEDVKIKGYPRKMISEQNPQMNLEIGHQHIDVQKFDLKDFAKKHAQ